MFQGTSVLSPIIPFSFVVVPAFIIYRKSAEHVYENHPALYILSFGMVAAKVTNRLVVRNSAADIICVTQWLRYYSWHTCFPGCSYDQKWDAIFGQFTNRSSHVVSQSILQLFHQRVLCSLAMFRKSHQTFDSSFPSIPLSSHDRSPWNF